MEIKPLTRNGTQRDFKSPGKVSLKGDSTIKQSTVNPPGEMKRNSKLLLIRLL
jgi:hypothetical protein